MWFETVESVEEEIKTLEDSAGGLLTEDQKRDTQGKILERKSRRNLVAAREIWIIVMYTIFLAVLFSLIPLYAYNITQDCMIRQLFYIGSAGGLGGIVYSILGFTRHYDRGDFNYRYKWWYFFRPIIAVILGVFSYFFIAGGLLTFTSSSPEFVSVCSVPKAVMFYCAIAFLAGLSTNAFVKKLNDLADTLFKNVDDTEKDLAEKKKELSDATSEVKNARDALIGEKEKKIGALTEKSTEENKGNE
jgi:hypothetical protein